MAGHEIRHLCYADDVVLIVETKDDLQRLLQAFYRADQDFMKILKTKNMTVAEPIRCKLVIDDSPVIQVMTFDYFGCKISGLGCLMDNAKRNINKATVFSSDLKNVMHEETERISTESRVYMYKLCIQSVMKYASKTRVSTVRTKRLITK